MINFLAIKKIDLMTNNPKKIEALKTMGGIRLMRYETQADEKVSSICRKWHGVTMPIDQIEGIIPQHQNCRCRWIPDT